jgi:hypothetical protein
MIDLKNVRSATRSPLKAAALRNPGESLGVEIHRLLSEDASSYIFLGVYSLTLSALEWIRWYFKSPPTPGAVSLFALGACSYAGTKVFQIRRKVRMLRQGREGEKAVGQYLERLREKGYQILHDVPGENFNIDHVIVGRTGVYVIETKTISKPKSGKPMIEYDGEQVKVNGFTPDRNPVTQAKALTSWLREFIKESTGRHFPVRPVVLYPGWYITQHPKSAEVWVLNPKGLPAFLDHEGNSITPEDVHLVTYHLCRYVRNRNGKRHAA